MLQRERERETELDMAFEDAHWMAEMLPGKKNGEHNKTFEGIIGELTESYISCRFNYNSS